MVLLLGLGAWLWLRPAPSTHEPEAEAPTASAPSGADIVAQKRARRSADEDRWQPVRLVGRVVTAEDEAPIAGALVLLTPKTFEGGVAEAGQRAEPVYATTDAGGGFSLPGVPPGRYTIAASALGFISASQRKLTLRAGAEPPPIALRLPRGGFEVSGTVEDVSGGPVDGALVAVTRVDDQNVLSFDRSPAGTLSDDEGRFSLTLASGSYSAAISHPDYVSTSETFDVVAGPRTLRIRMTPGAVVEGTVRVRGSEDAVAGAVVVATAEAAVQRSGGFRVRGFGEHRVVTDAQGRFRLAGLPSGIVGFVAQASDHASTETTELSLGIAQTMSDVTIWVEPAFSISGFVVPEGAEEEQGIEGVWVGALSLRPPGLFVARRPSESDGYFEIPGVQAGNYMVAALGEDQLPNLTGTSAQVEDRSVQDVLVVMRSGVTVSGRVDPPGPATVALSVDTEGMGFSGMLTGLANAFVRTRTDEEGRFELHPVAPGKLRVVANADDGSHGEVEVEVADDGASDVVVELEPRVSIEGTVVSASGVVVADAKVSATRIDGDEARSGVTLSSGSNPLFGGGTPTREDGSFEVLGLEPGEYEVRVRAGRGPSLRWADGEGEPDEPKPFTVPPGGLAGIRLRVEAREGVIDGAVVDSAGAPVSDAWVTARLEGSGKARFRELTRARSRGGKQLQARMQDDRSASAEQGTAALAGLAAEKPVLTDDAGRFRITGLRQGTYVLTAEAEGGRSRTREDSVALGSDVTLQVQPLASVRGRVTAGTKVVSRYTITFKGPSPRSKNVANDEGRYALEGLDPGVYEVRVSSESGVGEAEVEVERGDEATADIELDAYGTLRGTVVSSTGDPLSGLTLVATGEGGTQNMSGGLESLMGNGPRTDRRGRFEIQDVPPGPGTLAVFDPDSGEAGGASVKYEVDPGGTTDLGSITATAAGDVPVPERGELGLQTAVRDWTHRPLAPAADDSESEDVEAPTDPERDRLWIRSVDQDGPAYAAGVRPGDEIIAIEGREVAGLGASAAAGQLSPSHVRGGDEVAVTLLRDGSEERVTIEARLRRPRMPSAGG